MRSYGFSEDTASNEGGNRQEVYYGRGLEEGLGAYSNYDPVSHLRPDIVRSPDNHLPAAAKDMTSPLLGAPFTGGAWRGRHKCINPVYRCNSTLFFQHELILTEE